MNDLDRIKSRIQQCLAVASNQASCESEIEQATRVAAALMAKYNLERSDFNQSDENNFDPSKLSYGRYFCSGNSGNRVAWELDLAKTIVKIIGTVSWYWEKKKPELENGFPKLNENGETDLKIRFVFYGPDTDAQWCAQMFEEMRLQIKSIAIVYYGTWARKDGGVYCEGFVAGFREAHAKAQKLINNDQQTKALIVVSNEKQLAVKRYNKQWLKESTGIKLSKGSGLGGARGSSSAREKGFRDGKNSPLPQPKQQNPRIN